MTSKFSKLFPVCHKFVGCILIFDSSCHCSICTYLLSWSWILLSNCQWQCFYILRATTTIHVNLCVKCHMRTNIAAILTPLSQPLPDYIIVTSPPTMDHCFAYNCVHNICNIHMLSNPLYTKIHFFLTRMYLLLQLCKAQANRQRLNGILPQKAPPRPTPPHSQHPLHKPLLLQQVPNRISFVYGARTPGVRSTLSNMSCAATSHIRFMPTVRTIAEWPTGSPYVSSVDVSVCYGDTQIK